MPRLTPGFELYGEYQGSGFTDPQYVARRGDGQVLQLSRLLHLVASEIDGRRDLTEIAERVAGAFGRGVSPGNIAYLIQHKLQPLGVVARESGEPAPVPRLDLLLVVKGRWVLLRPQVVGAIARALQWLHHPAIVVFVLAAWLGLDVWFFGFHGAIEPLLAILRQPVLMLAVMGLTVASLMFHEFGHASACRYSGARPGVIGCGLYLIWPALYTDVTDVYRVNRAGRLRTDLGGVYFNVVFMLVMAGCYAATDNPIFLVVVFVSHFTILEQLMPIVRLDGYFILGDLAGVPDLFGKVRPVLARTLLRRSPDPRVAGLKKSTRVVVTAWVLAVVPILGINLAYLLWNLPRILETGLRSFGAHVDATVAAWSAGQVAAVVLGAVSVVLLALPPVGLTYLLVQIGRRVVRAAVVWTAGRPARRLALMLLATVMATGLTTVWIFQGW